MVVFEKRFEKRFLTVGLIYLPLWDLSQIV